MLVLPAAALAFTNTEPDAAQQWYLTQDNAWTFWATRPHLATVRVAVIDSGIDAGHPEFVGKIAAGASFVGGSWKTDTCGHGTFVAGVIAANGSNDQGIAGMAFNAKLLIAKVVQSDCNVSTEGEIKGIYWAVNHGARVINLSIGGIRDPEDSELDSFSAGEEAALEYAYKKGVLVVAAVGNGTAGPADALALRRLPGGAAARARRRRDQGDRRRPGLLRPRLAVRRHRCARRPDLLDHPAQPRRRLDPRLHGHAVLQLRAGGVPERDRHLVLDAAGHRRRRAADRRRPVAEAVADRVAARALGHRREPRDRLPLLRDVGRDSETGWGDLERRRRAEAARQRARPARRPMPTSRTTMPTCRGRRPGR